MFDLLQTFYPSPLLFREKQSDSLPMPRSVHMPMKKWISKTYIQGILYPHEFFSLVIEVVFVSFGPYLLSRDVGESDT